MTRSIFDPSNPGAEHSGSRNLGPTAQNISHLPPDIADAKVEEALDVPDTSPVLEQIADEEEASAELGRTTPAD